MFREKTVDVVDMWRTVDNFAAPGLVNFEVQQFQDRARDGPVIHLFIAQNVKFDFGPDFSTLVNLSLNIDLNADQHSYVPAIQPETMQVGDCRPTLVLILIFNSSGYWNLCCQDNAATVAYFTLIVTAESYFINAYR